MWWYHSVLGPPLDNIRLKEHASPSFHVHEGKATCTMTGTNMQLCAGSSSLNGVIYVLIGYADGCHLSQQLMCAGTEISWSARICSWVWHCSCDGLATCPKCALFRPAENQRQHTVSSGLPQSLSWVSRNHYHNMNANNVKTRTRRDTSTSTPDFFNMPICLRNLIFILNQLQHCSSENSRCCLWGPRLHQKMLTAMSSFSELV